MKSLLVIIPRLPFPLNSGGRILIYNSLLTLSSKFKLEVVILEDKKIDFSYLEKMRIPNSNFHFFKISKLEILRNLLRSLIKFLPIQVEFFYSKSAQNRINSLLPQSHAVLCYMIRTTEYVKNIEKPKYLYAIDSMFLNYSNSLSNTTSIFWKSVYRFEIPRLDKYEKHCLANFNSTFFVSKSESDFWSKYGNSVCIPQSLPDTNLSFSDLDSKFSNCLVFIGRMDYQPNIDAIFWFIENVFVHINPNLKLLVIGGYLSDKNLELILKYKNVEYLGFVEFPEIIIASALCCLSPMVTGGGLQTKNLFYLSLGAIVVSNSMIIESMLGNIDESGIIIENNSIQMARRINDIFLNSDSYKSNKIKGREYINKYYSESVISSKLLSQIN